MDPGHPDFSNLPILPHHMSELVAFPSFERYSGLLQIAIPDCLFYFGSVQSERKHPQSAYIPPALSLVFVSSFPDDVFSGSGCDDQRDEQFHLRAHLFHFVTCLFPIK